MADPPINVSVTGITGGHADNIQVIGINQVTGPDPLHDILERTKDEVEYMTAGMIRVSAVDVVVNKLSSGQHWVTITGNAGDGKTTLGYLVLGEFLQKGVVVFTLYKPEEYDQIEKMKEDKLIMFDDRFGAFLADHQLIKSWIDVILKISRVIEKGDPKTKVIFISRKNVVNESKVYLGHLTDTIFDRERVVDLSKGKLTQERRKIMDYHLRLENVTIHPEIKTIVCNMEIAHGFPHCCKMFSKLRSKGYNVPIEEFFESPLKFLDKTTKVLYNDNCTNLFQLMIKNDGQLDIYDIKDEAERHDLFKVEKEQEGSYITVWRNGTCQFAHPSVYESVLNVINDIDPLFCVQYATLSVLRQKMIISTSDEEERSRSACYVIVKPIPAVLKAVAERFREEILEGDYSVFKHRLCRSKEFCEALVSCCVTTDEKENGSKQFINQPGDDGETMLCTAARNRHMAAVHTLVKAGTDVNIQDHRGRTPLHYLCQLMISNEDDDDDDEDDDDNDDDYDDDNLYPVDLDTLRLIINKGRGDVNICDQYGQTPLHYLCQIKNSISPAVKHNVDKLQNVAIEAMRLIISEGRGDVNICDQYGQTPLHYLCQVGNYAAADGHCDDKLLDVVINAMRLIISEGRGDVNICDQYEKTPLHYLCQVRISDDGDGHCDDKLLDVVISAMRLIISEGRGDVNIGDRYEQTPLHYLCQVRISAADDGHYDDKLQDLVINAMRLIITEGRGDVNIGDRYEQTPLHYLCQVRISAADDGHNDDKLQDVVINAMRLIMIEENGDINNPDKFGKTPLHYLFKSCTFTSEEIQWIFTQGKGDLNKCEQHKSTPLHYLCANSSLQLDTVDLVIMEGKGDFNKGDEHGTTPLHHLCQNGKLELDLVFQIVNTAKGDINKQDENGITPLHVLCKGSLPMQNILTLINQEDKADMYGNTPLHFLCRRRGINAEELQELGQLPETDMKKENVCGYTPLDYLTDQDDSLPWQDGMIARCAADLVLCRLKHGDNWIIVLGRAMILNSERVHWRLQVEDFGRVLTNLELSGYRNSPGQFSWFWGTCSSPVPVPPSPSPLTTPPSYWETSSTLTRRKRGYRLLEMGLKLGRGNMDEEFCVSRLPHFVCVSVTDDCDHHPDRLCIQVRRRDQEDRWKHQVGECVSLSLPTRGVELTLTFGLVLDVGRGRVGFIDVERGQLLCKVDLQMKDQVFPMFYVYPVNNSCATRMRLVSGREICVTDRKIHLIQQALSD